MGELDAYVILYGQDADNLDRAITVGEASTMSFTIPDLAAGDWYFAIQVVDTQGLVSAPSRVVSKSI
ncbi:MAG: fibronectin type III domain-containing protein [Oleiphilaceae bacterium]|nr:fibronectin type III domain-containing protein [Oleiphilaceae bacterium]